MNRPAFRTQALGLILTLLALGAIASTAEAQRIDLSGGVTASTSRVALRLAYTADRVTFVNGSSEFVDGVELGLRISRF